jgi:hypothetical protein
LVVVVVVVMMLLLLLCCHLAQPGPFVEVQICGGLCFSFPATKLSRETSGCGCVNERACAACVGACVSIVLQRATLVIDVDVDVDVGGGGVLQGTEMGKMRLLLIPDGWGR